MNLDDIQDYDQLKKVIDKASWQSFERLVGKIFGFHDYQVKVSEVVTFDETKRQYDVIAEDEKYQIIVDCKKWDNKRKIKYGLKKAAKDQIERVKRLENDKTKYPVLVLSGNSPIEYNLGVPIIPVTKLNSFISNFQINKPKILEI